MNFKVLATCCIISDMKFAPLSDSSSLGAECLEFSVAGSGPKKSIPTISNGFSGCVIEFLTIGFFLSLQMLHVLIQFQCRWSFMPIQKNLFKILFHVLLIPIWAPRPGMLLVFLLIIWWEQLALWRIEKYYIVFDSQIVETTSLLFHFRHHLARFRTLFLRSSY